MDVNRDGAVSAGDITQMQQRTIGNLGEFAQVGNDSKDWVFIPSETILTDYSYRISANYPRPDGVGYSRLQVPVVTDLMELPVEGSAECPVIDDENYKGILLGDVTGNYAAQANDPGLKSASSSNNQFILDLDNAILANDIFEVPVLVNASDLDINAYDLSFYINSEFEFSGAVDLADMNEACGQVNDLVKCTGYTFNNFEGGSLVSLKFKANRAMTSNDINVKTATFNESVEADLIVKGAYVPNAVVNNSLAKLNIYPNPANDLLYVEVSAKATIQLLDISGKSVLIEKVVSADEKNEIHLDGIASGIYLMKVYNNEFTQVQRIVIQK